ncbi:MAG TPA: LuxR C-terminal-related transcriptional regulator [Noviherbaspirillum sp.]|uniref:LuxR C-terminal-related transcriptional regulator n=1 Tax=Noviherbaspirillum sp. TaxID=1926288 RepID=UPI002B4942C9|nr:LuxR C-terminal-related transcriptional regulator [Noviherbaspirillum sp.]HJV85274.1 LuxR C-terminal-related transcriptional regulator [Noviherbaspirillum sp.]
MMNSSPRSAEPLAGTILGSKLRPPTLAAGTLPRRKLLEALDAAPDWRVLLLRAPAGYGKTTLMSQLSERLAVGGACCRWLTMDPRDDDINHLLTHLQAVIGQPYPGQSPESRGSLVMPHMPDLGIWLNEVARLPGQQILFLDELESVQEPAALALLGRLLRFAPDNLRIVIGTRPESGLALSRMKAGGMVLEWSARQLRFDADETRAFLQGRGGSAAVPSAWHALLAERCEGWPAILRLSALALNRSEAPHGFAEVLKDGASDLAEYLAGEIFERQPPEQQSFLLHTSVLRYLEPDLCDALCEGENSAQWLHDMGRRNQFVIPLDSHRSGAYRYHALLADFLRARLERRFPGMAEQLHRKAATWLEQHGQLIDAVGHAMEAGDPVFAAGMLERSAKQLVKAGNLATLLHWIKRLPAHIADDHPDIVWAAARAHTYFHQIDEAEARLRQLFSLAESRPFDTLVWEDCLALEALMPAVDENVEQVMKVTARNLPKVTGDYALGIMSNVRAYGEIALSRFDAALKLLDQADRYNRKVSNLFGLSATVGLRAAAWSARGDLHRAIACYTGVDVGAPPVDHAQIEYASVRSGLHSEILYESDRLDEAQALLAIHAPAEGGYLEMGLLVGGHLTAARLLFVQGDVNGAMAILDETLARAVARRFYRLAFACRWEKVRLATLSNQMRVATTLAAAAQHEPQEAHFHFTTDAEARDISWIRLQIRLGKGDAMLPLIERLLQQAQSLDRGWRALKLCIMRACALDAIGQSAAADDALATAMAAGSSHGFIRSFADEGEPVLGRIAQWLTSREMLPQGVVREHAERVLRAGGRTVPSDNAGAEAGPASFNPREREMLRALAQGEQNRELAARFQISENTVKWYLKNLYVKLDAHNRAQAIARGRQWRLID